MIMRLLEGELRAASITFSAAGLSFTTQASNFSLARRSAVWLVMATASMPNCLKHSARTRRAGSLTSTKAARAAAFRVGGMAVRFPRALSMKGMGSRLKFYCGLYPRDWQRVRSHKNRYRSAITVGEERSEERRVGKMCGWGRAKI